MPCGSGSEVRRQFDDFEDLARVRIELLNQVVASNQAPDLAVVPVETVRTIAFDRNQAQNAQVVFRVELRQRVDAQRTGPQRLRLLDPRVAVDAASHGGRYTLIVLPVLMSAWMISPNGLSVAAADAGR